MNTAGAPEVGRGEREKEAGEMAQLVEHLLYKHCDRGWDPYVRRLESLCEENWTGRQSRTAAELMLFDWVNNNL